MMRYTYTLRLPARVVAAIIWHGRHYVRTELRFFGDELIAVSSVYLNACLPSRAEMMFGLVGGLLLGSGIVQIAVTLTTTRTWPHGLFGISFLGAGALAWLKQWRLRRARLIFLKSEEAKPIPN